MIQGHGDDIYKYKNILSNFSSNIYTENNLHDLQNFLCTKIHTIHSYPEPDAESLKQAIANLKNIDINTLCITNGATEAIYLIAQAFKNFKTAIIIPTFSEYEDACAVNKHSISFYKSLEEITTDIQLVWICNPNNPTGYCYDKHKLIEIIKQHPKTLFVFDQSYQYFTKKEVWNANEVEIYKNIILINSMTKNYTIPGLRLGYIIANNSLISLINKYRMPWSVNQLAIEAGKYLIKKQNDINLDNYLIETKRLQTQINKLDKIKALPTDTHFFLCYLENKTASDLKLYLIEHHGILIRDAANFRGLNKYYFRIATQNYSENNNLIKALTQWL